jgi:phenylalanyl-tRNA synthetase beta chain
MKVSEKWLREWVNPSLTTDELVAQITMAGLEVDSVEPVAGKFSSVVVAEIMQVEPHPDADKLRVCQVACGDEELTQVVCGASNARVGIKVPFAKVGAELPGDFKIKEAKLRGVASFGMLCGASELGMEDKVDGLMELSSSAPVGIDIREYLQLNDNVLDVDLTPNRGDCLSVLGLAREIAVLNKLEMNMVEIPVIAAQHQDIFPIEIEALEECPQYVGRVIKGIDLSRPTPLWMVEKLRRSGIRSIDAVVDVTNYVLLELGQPMHAFDLSALDTKIIVRKSKVGEKITLLDDQDIELTPDSLLIADNTNALALAGIMGGKNSGVDATTKDILLESAFFEPEKVAGKARAYGLHTDSSHRFERGVDCTQQARAIERATALLLDIVGGEPGPVNVVNKTAAKVKKATLSRKRLAQVLGLDMSIEAVTDILQRLGIDVKFNDDVWHCVIPSYRFDISIEADLIEEIARVYGYNKLPTRGLRVPVEFKARSESVSLLSRVRHQLLALGYQEAITYSFIEPKLQALFSQENPINVANPISTDMSVMRTSLLPGLVSALLYNVNRQQTRVRLFESGLQFHKVNGVTVQNKYIAGVIYGAKEQEGWANASQPIDFYDIKGDVQSVLAACSNKNVDFITATHHALHPGQTAELLKNGQKIGVIGALHPEVTKSLGITGSILVFELSLEGLLEGNVPNFKALSRFPQVRRDIAVQVDAGVEAKEILAVVKKNAGEWQKDCIIFDVYSGQGVAEGKKSLAVGITFQHPERSLQDEEIQVTIDKIVAALQSNVGALLRK